MSHGATSAYCLKIFLSNSACSMRLHGPCNRSAFEQFRRPQRQSWFFYVVQHSSGSDTPLECGDMVALKTYFGVKKEFSLLPMESEQEPFLHKEAEKATSIRSTKISRPTTTKFLTWTKFLCLQALLLAVYSITTAIVVRSFRYKAAQYNCKYFQPLDGVDQLNIFKAPLADLKIEYTQSIFHNLSHSPFAGAPSAKIDASWEVLLAPMNIRVSEAELQHESLRSVALPEGGGYLSWLGAFHQLHCIVRCSIGICANED